MEKRSCEQKRKIRTRAKIKGISKKLRLSVFRSNRFIYAQIVDDEKKKTILGVSEKDLNRKNKTTGKKIDSAKELGVILAEKAKEKKIKEVVFDRGSYAYLGRVKAFAEGAREGGLKF
ncbi:MAG: 50S ribosomal protein L18 [Patescibacteria group bacterium]|nr:50S ribosomal protein L18 [Patescibacteria group bacterium]